MVIAELIEQLSKIQEKFGNIDVKLLASDYFSNFSTVATVVYVDVREDTKTHEQYVELSYN